MANKKCIIASAITIVIVAGLSFYGGMQYQKSQTRNNFSSFQNGDFQSIRNNGRISGAGNGANIVNGQIISKDEDSITVKIQDGSSKIIFLSGNTQINKFDQGTLDDISNGQNVMITGTSNSDGSITAQSIQIRPSQEQ
jgi:hypothetical protein